MSTRLNLWADIPDDGIDGACRDCGSYCYGVLSDDGYCPECLATIAHEDYLEDMAIMDRDDPIDFYQGDDE